MIQRLRFREFADRFCENDYIRKITFSSENQPYFDIFSSVRVTFTFSSMLAAYTPDALLLTGECGTMQFDRVEYVSVESSFSTIGVWCDIVCRRAFDGNDLSHNIIQVLQK